MTILLFVAFFWDIYLIAFGFTRNDRRATASFVIMNGALTFYSLGYLLEILATTPGEIMMALRIENLGIPLLAPFYLLMALGFFQTKWLKPWMLWAGVAYGALMCGAVFFNDTHHLYYAGIEMQHNGYFYVGVLDKGPLYYVQQGVTFSVMAVAYALLGQRFIRGSKKVRSQMSLFIAGSFFAFGVNLVNILGIAPLGIDMMPLAMSIGMVFFSFNLRRHNMMDIVPAAFNMAVETMDNAVVVMDSDWGFVYCNRRAQELVPALRDYSGTEDVTLAEGWPAVVHSGIESPTIFRMEHPKTGKELVQKAAVRGIHNKRGNKIGVGLFLDDITEITGIMDRLEQMAVTDPLTGVFNRRHFAELMARQMSLAQRHDLPMAILLMDIDHFKRVNDTYSHLAGDKVLCHVVNTIKRQLRAHDVIARYGGEEFVVVSAEKVDTGLLALGNRLRRAIENEVIVYEGQPIRVTASFGAVMIAPGQSYEEAMSAVDKALYVAKDTGRNRVVLGAIDGE